MIDHSRLISLQRILGGIALTVGILVAVGTFRMYSDGERHYSAGEQLQRTEGPMLQIVLEYEEAARAYFPGSPYPKRSLHKLLILAKSAQMRGERQLALYIWDVIRRSTLVTRHLFQPNKNYLVASEKAILVLRDTSSVPPDEIGNLVAHPDDPSVILSLVLFLGIAMWIGGTVAVCVFHPSRTTAVNRQSVVSVITACAGFGLWVLVVGIV